MNARWITRGAVATATVCLLVVVVWSAQVTGDDAWPTEVAEPGRPAAPSTSAGTAKFPTIDWRQVVAPPTAFRSLLKKAAANGSVRAMVGLQVQWQPEGALDAMAQAAQRAAIATATRSLVDSLHGTDYVLVRSYPALPFVTLRLSVGALKALPASGLVPNLHEDALDPPTLGTSGPAVEATETSALGLTGSGETIAVVETDPRWDVRSDRPQEQPDRAPPAAPDRARPPRGHRVATS
jgi:hypothetical protein